MLTTSRRRSPRSTIRNVGVVQLALWDVVEGGRPRTGVTEHSVWMADERSLEAGAPSATDAEVTRRLEHLIDALHSHD